MEAKDLLELAIASNPLAYGVLKGYQALSKRDAAPAVGQQDSVNKARTSVSTSAENKPEKQEQPTGGISGQELAAIMDRLVQAQVAEAQKGREFAPVQAEIDRETFRQQVALAEAAGLEKMREKTSRDIELQTIAAWQGVTQAQIQRDAAMGLGMMNLAYQSGMPNSALLQSAAALAAAGGQGFGTPASVLK